MIFLPLLITVSMNIPPEDVQENFISLRDYDFVGQDKRLAFVLAERMANLSKEVDLSDFLFNDNLTAETSKTDVIVPPNFDIGPDRFNLKSQRAHRVNVSLDYAEMFNGTVNIGSELNEYWFGRQVNGSHIPIEPVSANATGNLTAGRRSPPVYRDLSYWHYNLLILDIMKQSIYTVQQRFLDIEHIIKAHEDDVRFRMSYIFSRLDEWKKDIRNLYYMMKVPRTYHIRVKVLLFYYQQVLRKNIDITYTVEYLIHLHTGFMDKMEDIIPRDQLEQMQKAAKLKQQMKKPDFNKTLENLAKEENPAG